MVMAMAALPSLRPLLRTLLPLPSSILRLHVPLLPHVPPSLLLRPALSSLFASPLLRFPTSHLLQVRCSGSLKAKGKPRGPLWRQRKGVSKEALQVVFELKQCKGDRQKERKVLQSSGSRLLKMDLLMVLVELRRQEECSLAQQVNFSPFHLGVFVQNVLQFYATFHFTAPASLFIAGIGLIESLKDIFHNFSLELKFVLFQSLLITP
ncbi:hypothetical protein M758_11G164100 [Ceratodon purpureus]|nr:hypothetical protein M758_11G164100 [Ceratodon purpureus]KAG0602163.1 hypothetical protein M758_11G164100 [Ceratodon purpureus]